MGDQAQYMKEVMEKATPVTEVDVQLLKKGNTTGVFLGRAKKEFDYEEISMGECYTRPDGFTEDIVQMRVQEWANLTNKALQHTHTVYHKDKIRTCYPSTDFDCDYDDWQSNATDSATPAPQLSGTLVSSIIAKFPVPSWPMNPGLALWQPNVQCDVFAMTEDNPTRLGMVQSRMRELAASTHDRVVPKYQNLIDPNLFVEKGRWVASEWDISEAGTATIVGADAAHERSSLVDEVYTPVLEAALPVLCTKLTRPALHFAGRRLQAVPKAQRIVVPPAGVLLEGEEASEGGTYEGLWHSDGDVEDIVAVVLYYYNVDTALEGGAMEFAAKDVHDVVGWGDCSNNISDVTQHNLESIASKSKTIPTESGYDGRERSQHELHPGFPSCKVPVETGTILVFSNYQVIHRVLRIMNQSSVEASRDFVALFIVDPAGTKLASAAAFLRSQEYLNQTAEFKVKQRLTKLRAQLLPQGSFGSDRSVYSTGNGCFMTLKWVQEELDMKCLDDSGVVTGSAYARITRTPKQVNRGLSELLSEKSTHPSDA